MAAGASALFAKSEAVFEMTQDMHPEIQFLQPLKTLHQGFESCLYEKTAKDQKGNFALKNRLNHMR